MTAAGWYADPAGRHEHRYWNGSGWADQVSDRGVTSTDSDAVPGPDAAPGATLATSSTDPVILTIGDIGITRHWVVTPNGSAPLQGSQWIARDATREESHIPPYAIVLAIPFALATASKGWSATAARAYRTADRHSSKTRHEQPNRTAQISIPGALAKVSD